MANKNIIAIVQARCNSSRLKNKIFMEIGGKPLIERVIERSLQSEIINKIVVATTVSASDDLLVDWCKKKNYECFRGSENNVLERYYKCAEFYKADVIVRITADDPFKDSKISDRAIKLLIENNYDYVSNTIQPTFPEGLDIEVFTCKSLSTAYKKATLDSEKEHVTPYIWKNKDQFYLFNFEHSENLSHLRWTIDYRQDLDFARAIYRKIKHKKEVFIMKDILDVLKLYPELSKIQSKITRNEGYKKSIKVEI
jgi:spore coat polysaccharide biosynthesis protein SpsF (cytidylyltransferase family)